MKFLTSLALLASTISATPLNLTPRQQSKSFHIKTTDAAQDQHNNLYVYAYHTGAGLNDAVLSADAGDASPAFMNNTNVQFDLDTPFPWGVKMVGASNYGAWQPVQINTGYGTPGFSLDESSLKWSEQNGFGGWLVCDWYHSAPQLFYLYGPYEDPKIPSSCSEVELKAEYI